MNEIKQYKRDMFDQEFQLILRIVLQLTKDGLGTFQSRGEIGYAHDYTGNHIAIFEATLRSPPAFAMVDHTYEEYVNHSRLNFKNFRLVDFDNYMKGNAHYSEFVTSDTWIKRNKETWDDSKLDTQINGEEGLKPFMKLIQDMKEFNKIKEPASNYDMPIRNRIKQAEQEKIDAQLKSKAAEEAPKEDKKAQKPK